ncbi:MULTISPECIES: hypothetical protein [unclassified Sphingomonas]|uniref:hypothetical protein n=1 Tax=unclassified Sphingomonas TaxID=196159 RepID=UPI0006FD8CCA|nr:MULTISPECIES: hypothetical protein [unclassified Sphingomonas]KQX25124.1 hypothetical protein ASD17_23960 [Sphingomonas sp. Root1294]KQY66141.1 hypothetical protein ASD39_13760 [Sphingomonas sp. Root50]
MEVAEELMRQSRKGDAIAIVMKELAGDDDMAGWRGGSSHLTGDPAFPSPTRRLLVGESVEACGEAFSWRGRRVSSHRAEPGDARGLVLTFIETAPEAADEFEDWYESEHMPRLAALPGIFQAGRYQALPGHGPTHLAFYLMSDLALSQSAQWMAAARTPWSARMRRFSSLYTRYSFWREP